MTKTTTQQIKANDIRPGMILMIRDTQRMDVEAVTVRHEGVFLTGGRDEYVALRRDETVSIIGYFNP